MHHSHQQCLVAEWLRLGLRHRQVAIHKHYNIGITYFPGEGDVWFSLRNKTYQNNSSVPLEDIGENDIALLCRTNLSACCTDKLTGTGSASGDWIFPNGTRVPSMIVDQQRNLVYRTRGHSVVRLNRRRGGVEGIYRCDIPDSTNVTQSIYIGVYTADTGE